MAFIATHENKPDCETTVDAHADEERILISCICGWEDSIEKHEGFERYGSTAMQLALMLLNDHFGVLATTE